MEEPLPERAAILRAAIGIGLYAMAFGASFGAISVGSGLTLAQTMVLSLVMFTGASQFAFVGVADRGRLTLCSSTGEPPAWSSQRLLWRTSFGDPAPARLSQAMDRSLRDRRNNGDGGEPSHPTRPTLRILGHWLDLVLPLAAWQPVWCTHWPRGQPQRRRAGCCRAGRLLGPAVAFAAAPRGTLGGTGRRSSRPCPGPLDTTRHPGGRRGRCGTRRRATPESPRR